MQARLFRESIVPNEPCIFEWHDRTKRGELDACVFHHNIRSKATVKVAKVANGRLCHVPAFVLYLSLAGLLAPKQPKLAGVLARSRVGCSSDAKVSFFWPAAAAAAAAAANAAARSSNSPCIGCAMARSVERWVLHADGGVSFRLSEIQMVGVNSATPPEIKSCSRYISCR